MSTPQPDPSPDSSSTSTLSTQETRKRKAEEELLLSTELKVRKLSSDEKNVWESADKQKNQDVEKLLCEDFNKASLQVVYNIVKTFN